MNKSQLRKLAREFALGRLEEDEYRQRRRDLVRDIVDGKVAIVREAPPPPPPPSADTGAATIEAAVPLEPVPERPKLSPLHIGAGVLIVAALVWLFLPSPAPEQAGETVTVEQPIPEPRVSPARGLVEEFVASRDWSEYTVSRFMENWNALSDADRQDAATARWFNELIIAINEEIKTQNALVNFDTSGNAVRTGERFAELAAFLGIEDEVTAFRGTRAAAPAGTAQESSESSAEMAQEPPAETAQEPSAEMAQEPSAEMAQQPPAGAVQESSDEAVQRSSAGAARPSAASGGARPEAEAGAATPGEDVAAADPATESLVSNRKTMGTISGARWLDSQPAEAFALQLFAVNHLEKIQELIRSNPGVDLEVLVSAHSEPRYRVIHGSFESAAAARDAHAALPEAIRRAQPAPLVKTIGDLRKDIDNGDWIGTLNAEQYTLQLFATDNSNNARQLILKYPALNLSLLDTRENRSRYRVLYGTFDSEASARKAVSGLPRQLVRDAGDPLVKSVGELQAARR
jgi:septal ring-binding cell division protein DamX